MQIQIVSLIFMILQIFRVLVINDNYYFIGRKLEFKNVSLYGVFVVA